MVCCSLPSWGVTPGVLFRAVSACRVSLGEQHWAGSRTVPSTPLHTLSGTVGNFLKGLPGSALQGALPRRHHSGSRLQGCFGGDKPHQTMAVMSQGILLILFPPLHLKRFFTRSEPCETRPPWCRIRQWAWSVSPLCQPWLGLRSGPVLVWFCGALKSMSSSSIVQKHTEVHLKAQLLLGS